VSIDGLSSRQLAHAGTVVSVARAYAGAHGASPDYGARAADIALAVCLVESSLLVYANPNVHGSMALPHDAVGHDHHSVGLFQQQVPGWGTVAGCQGVASSATKFLEKLFGLDWTGRTNGHLAQLVQVSAYPDRYAARDLEAIGIRKALW
jgi:hypothetical protein